MATWRSLPAGRARGAVIRASADFLLGLLAEDLSSGPAAQIHCEGDLPRRCGLAAMVARLATVIWSWGRPAPGVGYFRQREFSLLVPALPACSCDRGPAPPTACCPGRDAAAAPVPAHEQGLGSVCSVKLPDCGDVGGASRPILSSRLGQQWSRLLRTSAAPTQGGGTRARPWLAG